MTFVLAKTVPVLAPLKILIVPTGVADDDEIVPEKVTVCPERMVAGDGAASVVVVVAATSTTGVIEKSSMARPSSEPVALKSCQRIQNVLLFAMLAETEPLIAVRFAAELPSFAPVGAVVTGARKFNAETLVHVPVFKLVASRLYWNVNESGRFVAPRRHCSPTYEISKPVIADPVLFVNDAPIVDVTLPLKRVPNARSAADAAP
ncbi:MAG: hypothetical protein WCL32_14310 [Planctomycetota bacterium]